MVWHVANDPLPVILAKMLDGKLRVVSNELVGASSTEGGGDAEEDERAVRLPVHRGGDYTETEASRGNREVQRCTASQV